MLVAGYQDCGLAVHTTATADIAKAAAVGCRVQHPVLGGITPLASDAQSHTGIRDQSLLPYS